MTRDSLKECNNQGVPLQDFTLQFCSRCMQPECIRSQFGKSLFEKRVTSWESRLFLEVPRMADEDPRYSSIAAKNFLQIDTSKPYEVRGWVDPLEEKSEAPPEDSIPVQDPPEVSVTASPSQGRRGRMVGVPLNVGVPVKADPWATSPQDTTVVKPGAKIRFGSKT